MEENILNLELLPTETLTEVLVDSTINTLQSLCVSSKKISQICNEEDEYLWKEKLRREYSDLKYKDIYLMTQAMYNIFILSMGNNRDTNNYEDITLLKKDKKINMIYYGGGQDIGVYRIIPDIVLRNYGNIIANYNVPFNTLLYLKEDPDKDTLKRLEIRTTFPNDMNIANIIKENRANFLTFSNRTDIGKYLTNIGTFKEYNIIDDRVDYDIISVYALKKLGIVNTFEYINRILTLT